MTRGDVYLGVGTTEVAGGGRTEPGDSMLLGSTDEWVGVDAPPGNLAGCGKTVGIGFPARRAPRPET